VTTDKREAKRWYGLLERERLRQGIDPMMSRKEPLYEMPDRYNGLIAYLRRLEARVKTLER
jgi:hypothetical protein